MLERKVNKLQLDISVSHSISRTVSLFRIETEVNVLERKVNKLQSEIDGFREAIINLMINIYSLVNAQCCGSSLKLTGSRSDKITF